MGAGNMRLANARPIIAVGVVFSMENRSYRRFCLCSLLYLLLAENQKHWITKGEDPIVQERGMKNWGG